MKPPQNLATRPASQVPQRAAPTILQCLGSEKWKEEVHKVLPSYLTAEMFLRVSRSVASDPKFAAASPESFLLAMIKCGRAGLVPDGRNAHLIPFGKDIQVIFDWKGLVAMAKRNGVEVTPKLVYSEDEFEVQEDDGTGNTRVVHKVNFAKPRGEILLVYSRAKTIRSGEVDYEFMTAEEVEDVRQNFSKAKDSLMWSQAWGEAAKKTVIRRHSKRWDLSPEDRAAINGDDDSLPVEVTSAVPARPLFQAPPKQVENGSPEPEAATPPEPEQPKSDTRRFLRAILGLLKSHKITEGAFLDLLATIGQSDGSVATVEELPVTVLEWAHDHWGELLPKLKPETTTTTEQEELV